MYKVVHNNQLDALNTRYSYLPTTQFNNDARWVGRFHKTQSFSIHPDGNISISFNNEDSNDSFTVNIQMARMSYVIDFNRNSMGYSHQNGPYNCSKSQIFCISIGDIFKHYFKTHLQFVTAQSIKRKTKKNGRNAVQNEEEDVEDENAYINESIMKSLKVHVNNTDMRGLLGSIVDWKSHDLRLWDTLLDEGFLKTLGNDFSSFCNTFVVLPIHIFDPSRPSLSDSLSLLSSSGMVKKLIRFFLFAEDPSQRGWVAPKRDFFTEAKSIVEIFNEYNKDLSERYQSFDETKRLLVKELNNKNKIELQEKYPPQTFSYVQNVGRTRPLHALRTIHLLSWCASDFLVVEDLVSTAHYISKSDRSKMMIKKRGKFQEYSTYETFENYPALEKRNSKFDKVFSEISV